MRNNYLFNLAVLLAFLGFTGTQAIAQLYPFTTHTFTPAGATGRMGPTLVDCQTAYASEAWTSNTAYFNMTTQGIQEWTVPATGNYEIVVNGAQGGFGAGNPGGNGATMIGEFALTQGQVLYIVVGQEGELNAGSASNDAGPGGGGSFVIDAATGNPLIAAGGGGGGGQAAAGSPGVTTEAGTAGQTSGGAGGINGGGGGGALNGTAGDGAIPGGTGTSCSYGTGGAGFYSIGGFNCDGNTPLISGFDYAGGFLGGEADLARGGTEGGFGGGGGVGHRASGGGGYSGGGGDGGSTGGGGGGSFNSGINQVNTGDNNSGDGSVVVTLLCQPLTPVISATTVCDEDTLVLHASSSNGGTITWDNGVTDSVGFVPASSGVITYTASSSDFNDCQYSVDITVIPGPDITLTANDEVNGNDGSISLIISSGTVPFTFDWDNDGTGDNDDSNDLYNVPGGTYTVIVTDGSGCTRTASATIGSQVGISDNENAFTTYPNPIDDQLVVEIEGEFNYVLTDASGKTVLDGNGKNKKVIDTSDLPSGTYFITVTGNAGTGTVSVIKN